jgi:hypothetical protein
MIRIGVLVLTLSFALAATPAHADGYPSPTDERVQVSLGVVRTSTTTDVQLNSSAGVPGTSLNAESTFGLDSSDFEPKAEVTLRAGERSRIRFDYFYLDRTGSAVMTQPIVFRDVTFQVGDPVQTTFSVRTLSIAYEYSFLHTQKYEVAAVLGVSDTDISTLAKVSTQTRHVSQSEDQAGPFPTAGLDATYVFSKRFYVNAHGQYMKVNIDDLQGSLGLYEFDALYRYRPNVALGLGYNSVRAHLLSHQASQSGYFDLDTSGPVFFVRVSF